MTPASTDTIAPVPLLVAGRTQTVDADRWEDVYNPSTGQVIARTPLCDAAQVDQVVQAAARALPGWAATPVVDRARILFKYRDLLEAEFEAISQLVTREHGKTLAESRAEVRRGIEVVEFACGAPSLMMGQSLPDIAASVDAEMVRHPVGVCVGITPYNFPAMIPLWMFPNALVCGNTFILKPSEKVPLSSMRLGELLLEAGLPEGVFNIVHGDRPCVEALLTHPQVSAVSFVGSTNTARAIYETGTRHGKRVQAAGGAKNHVVIMPDADLNLTVKALAASAYGCAGQRCMANSIAVPVGDVANALVDQLCNHAASLKVGPTDGHEGIDVGPLIRREHRDRVAGYLDLAAGENASVALDGRGEFDGNGFLLGPCVVDQVKPDSRLARDEIFGPVLSIIRAQDLDADLAIGDQCAYGNGAAIFTRDGYAARQFKRHFNAGMIGINVGVPAPMAWFPFTGWNNSFFGDLHIQGLEAIQFYTRNKVVLTRWFESPEDSHHDPVWKTHAKP